MTWNCASKTPEKCGTSATERLCWPSRPAIPGPARAPTNSKLRAQLEHRQNPFYTNTYDGKDFYALASYDRIRMVRDFTFYQCHVALQVDNLQKTVRTAINRRIRKLEKSVCATSPISPTI
jgi:hypothetical protein